MLEDHQAAEARVPVQPPADEPWPSGYPTGYAVVDVETTGLRREDRIVSAAVYRLTARGEVEDHWYTLVNPQRDPGPTQIHGLTARMLADAPLFPEIAGEFAERLAGRVLVAHNAVFDWMMIAREYARTDHTVPVEQRLCTIALSKALALPLANHKLETLVTYFGVTQRRAHHALDDARVLAEAFRPSLHRAARQRLPLPLHACRPLTEWTESPAAGSGPRGGETAWRDGWRGWRQSKRRPPCPFPNPGRYETGGRLIQGMRVAFSGDTSVDRELLEDQAFEAGLHIAAGVSRFTSLLVTNDPDAVTAKVVRARALGTPILDEAAFTQLLRDVAPAPEG
ncbi:DEDDh family exonuclease [Streptomyces litchfieldiae]|uniref:DEDDh family exonuclease n=1 Tax=Streptomyces litchfieldiae TaxID=3075543 RepID=A0ABU2MTA8_9ACTN|nr:DEDDh family exonuclease [Streptomyces sp. DSM 44938]MDT0344869.1 DEDDh family exonuclease [Streptomyces sp. DSM 44938]